MSTKNIYSLLGTLLFGVLVWAQPPEKTNYQAIIRNSSNNLVVNQRVSMRVSIIQGTPTGTVAYSETHSPTTDNNGTIEILIGGGTVQTGTISGINWPNGPFYVKIETDTNGGTNYNIMGTHELLSVPYALNAKNGFSAGTADHQRLTMCNGKPIWAINGICPEVSACDIFSTTINDVTNPTTGKIWMDRNLGASQVATSSSDTNGFGYLYQWGRGNDGHQCRTSPTTTTTSSLDQPTHGNFIVNASDWRSIQNDNLWQGVSGTNNPCPTGYRLPTGVELSNERASWTSGAYSSPLKLPAAGSRTGSDGFVSTSISGYWTSTVSGNQATILFLSNFTAMSTGFRSAGYSVRCIKDIPASINSLNCNDVYKEGTLIENKEIWASFYIPYTGGNGGTYQAQSIPSTGVNGLTATIDGGEFSNGDGTLYYSVSGTPTSSGIASFAVNIGGKSCVITLNVMADLYPSGYVNCMGSSITEVVEVTNPTTGKTWMDRNLGAGGAATNSNDYVAKGYHFQWGRFADGHQCRYNSTSTTQSNVDTPNNDSFIIGSTDWRSPQNDNLWQGVNGTNNPCPSGFRIPTQSELNAEMNSWSSPNAAGALASPLKLVMAGKRSSEDGYGFLEVDGEQGMYWSSSIDGSQSSYLMFSETQAQISSLPRSNGISVRCIKN